MSRDNAWARSQAKAIERALQASWGVGLSNLTQEHRNALVAEKVLHLILTQAMPQFSPAQDMAREVLDAYNAGREKK